MTQPDLAARRQQQGDVAALAGTIERLAADLALGEEPSGFAVALEAAAPRESG
jgi:hypothetical protein